MVKVSDVIVDFLLYNNINMVFGIIGSANSYIFDSISKNDKIKLVPTHHEQAAVMAMGAYYRATGRLSASIVTAGGGSSNAFTGILSNWADSIPGIIIAGQEQTYYIDEYNDMRMYGVQGYDSVETYKKHTKLSVRIDENNIFETLSVAGIITLGERPGPVYLEIPFDTQSKKIEPKKLKMASNEKGVSLKKESSYIVKKLNESKRPIILGGHGVKLSNSEKIFKDFVEKNKIPTVLSWSAVDLLETDNPYNFGRPGIQGQRAANFIVQNSDLILVLGSRLSLLQTGYSRENFAPNAEIIHIDIDSTETKKFNGKNYNVDVNSLLKELSKSEHAIKLNITDWVDYCNKVKNEHPLVIPEHLADPQNSYTFIDKLSKLWPDNYTIVTDMGTALLSGFYGFNIKPNQQMFTSLGLGEMGYGLAAAVGAGFGDRPVLCLNCDGGMMMNLQELQTIKTFNLPVKIIIFNNDGYLMIKHTQKMLFDGNKTCVDKNTGLELPDYEKIAMAFDYKYFTEDNIIEFINYSGQAIMEVFMNPNQEFIPKVRGIKQKDNSIKAGLLEEMYPLLPFDKIKDVMISGVNDVSKNIIR
jgi:acetolactate synthase-1/2/3 large subunit